MTIHIGMKQLLLLCSVVLLGLGCKRTVDPNNGSGDAAEIQISASSTASLDWVGKASHNTVPDDFDRFSSIGLYTQLKTAVGTENLLAGNTPNARFDYATPVWAPYSAADRLRYHETDPIYVYGYFPHSTLRGSRLIAGAKSHLFDFWLATDQTTSDSVKMSNLMWCLASGTNDEGYVRQSQPISMVFTHLLCKASVYVRVVDSRPGSGSPLNVQLRSVEFTPNPNVSPATDGQIGIRADFNAIGREDGVGGNGPLLTTTKVGTVKWTDGGLSRLVIPVTAAGSEPTFVTDFLLLPFTALPDENLIRFVLNYHEVEGPTVLHPFNVKIPHYTGTFFPPTAANGNGWRFGRNDHIKITVTVDVSTSYITLEATIKPWLTGSNNEIESENE